MTDRKGRMSQRMFSVLTVLLILNIWSTWLIDREVTKVIQRITIDHTTMATTWSAGGIKHTVKTLLGEFNSIETNLEHAIRHKGMVAGMLSVFPGD